MPSGEKCAYSAPMNLRTAPEGFGRPATDVGFGGLALRVQRLERLIRALLGGLARGDGAAARPSWCASLELAKFPSGTVAQAEEREAVPRCAGSEMHGRAQGPVQAAFIVEAALAHQHDHIFAPEAADLLGARQLASADQPWAGCMPRDGTALGCGDRRRSQS